MLNQFKKTQKYLAASLRDDVNKFYSLILTIIITLDLFEYTVWFNVFVLKHIKLHVSFNAKTILVEDNL